MYYTKVRLEGLFTTDFPIVGADPNDKFVLKGVDGLGPPPVDVFIKTGVNQIGSYQGKNTQSRQIVMRVGLNPDYSIGETVSDLRQTLYGLLTPGILDRVLFKLMNGSTKVVQATTHISKMVPNLFAKDPEVQITLECEKPLLEADSVNVSTGSLSKTAPAITNSGTAETGFSMSITLTSNLSTWSLTDANGKKIKFDYPFLSGDVISFNTQAGSRTATLLRGAGPAITLLGKMTDDSIWPQLTAGVNNFTTSSNAFNWGTVSYVPKYWGV